MLSLGQKLIAYTTLVAMNTMFVFFFGLASLIPIGFSLIAGTYIYNL